MWTKCEADIRGNDLFAEARQHATVRPRTSPIERGIITNLKAIVSRVGEKLRAPNQVQRIMWILDQHWLTMRKIGIVAHLNVGIWRLRMSAQLHTGTTNKSIKRHWRWCWSCKDSRLGE